MIKLPAIVGKSVSRRPSKGFVSRIARHPAAAGVALDAAVKAIDVGVDLARGWNHRATIRTESDAFYAKMEAVVKVTDGICRVLGALGDNGTAAHCDQLVGTVADIVRFREEGP